MPLVRQYSVLQKPDSSGSWSKFGPLRAAGFACELGHKYCRDKGLGSLIAKDLEKVSVAGPLQLLEQGSWRRISSCELQLANRDALLALKVVQLHRRFFSDIDFNRWAVDVPKGRGNGSADLLGDFSTPKNFGCTGRTWVELKLMADRRFDQKYQEVKEQLQVKLEKACKADPSICAVMLVVVKAQRVGHTWEPKTLVSQLLLSGCVDWKILAGRPPAFKRAGKTNPFTKPSLQEVWDKLGEEEVCPATHQKAYHLKHFLQALGLPCTSLKKRIGAFHEMLLQSGVSTKFRQVKIPGMPGSPPWMGTREMYRALYKSL